VDRVLLTNRSRPRPPRPAQIGAAAALVALAVLAASVVGPSSVGAQVPPPTTTTTTVVVPPPVLTTKVMRRAQVTAADLAGWYRSTGRTSKATVSMDELAGYYIQEGADEGVAGDIAFAQSIVETGYFFDRAGRVPPSANNFSGLGATDGTSAYEVFPDARTGVRAQIQHLRAYGDPSVTVANLAHPLVDTRFAKVNPKGKAPYWEQFGSGIWATDPLYAGKVLGVYGQIVSWARLKGPGRFAPHGTADAFVAQSFRNVLFREASFGERNLWATALRNGAFTPEFFVAELIRGEGAVTAQPVVRMYLSAFGRTTDPGGLAYWARQRKAGADLHRLAELLINSSEFRRRYGTPTDAAYVELLYQNVLGRAADGPGLAFWVGRLQSNRIDRPELLVQFSESTEHQRAEAAIVEVTIVHEGMLLLQVDADALAGWERDRALGLRLETLVFRTLLDPRYAARFTG
jgi:hypothetical protein